MAERLVNPKARKNRVICSSAPVPEGWVVVGAHHSPACDGDGANAWVVKLPGPREVVLADSPLPSGYRRVKETKLGDGSPAWVIEREA
jgi:hypothetical protein